MFSGPHFAIIDSTAQSCRSYVGAVKKLQKDETLKALLETLTETPVRSWYEPMSFDLKAAVQRRAEGGEVERSGRPSVMNEQPDFEEYVVEAIVIRAAGSNSLMDESNDSDDDVMMVGRSMAGGHFL